MASQDKHSAHVRGLILIVVAVLLLVGVVIAITVNDSSASENNDNRNGSKETATPAPSDTYDSSYDESAREDVGKAEYVTWDGVTYHKRSDLETVLLIGYDKDTEDMKGNRDGGQADFLVLAVIDSGARTVQLLQLNRDTMTRIRVYGITGRLVGTKELQLALSHAYTRNLQTNDENTKWAVENLLNISIDHTASMGFAGVSRINSLAGGVQVKIEDDMTSVDPAFVEGETITLTDEQALKFVRARRGVGDGTNVSRMRRQRAFINAFVSQTEARVRSNAAFVNTIVNTFYEVANISASKSWMVRRMNDVYSNHYTISSPVSLEATSSVVTKSDDMTTYVYTETYVNDDAIVEWVLQTLYSPVTTD